jgi:hypothetical protein
LETGSTAEEPGGTKALQGFAFAAFLAGAAAAFFLLRAVTPWEPATCMFVALGAGLACMVLTLVGWLKYKLWSIKRDAAAPDAYERIMNRPEIRRMTAELEADQKELGIDVEQKEQVARITAETGRKIDGLLASAAYLKASQSEQQAMTDRMVKEDMEAVQREIERTGEENMARVEALREWRRLEREQGGGRTPEERFRLQQLRDRAYGPGKA